MPTSETIDWRFFLDGQSAPFVLFDRQGGIRYLNDAAEILLGYTDRQELYGLALRYAPQTFGHRTTPIELQYPPLRFYAITVAYQDEEHIGIHLYYRPHALTTGRHDTRRMPLGNINTLLEAAIGLFALEHGAEFELLTDTDLPEFRLDQNGFSILLRKTLERFGHAARVRMTLTMPAGERIWIGETHHPLVRLIIQGDDHRNAQDEELVALAESMHIVATLRGERVGYDIPFVTA